MGYAVLQANYRGSTATPELAAAGDGEWGRKMQTDLTDGVNYLAGRGVIDPARVCIVGASYGGYAALAGASLQPDAYRCAISVAGISDLKLWLNKAGAGREWANYGARIEERWLGVKDAHDQKIADRSPIEHVDAIKAPILLIHGRDDVVVPYEQSSRMAEALRSHHKTYEIVDLKNEDHWLSHSDTRLQMLEATASFLQRYNPANVAATEAVATRH